MAKPGPGCEQSEKEVQGIDEKGVLALDEARTQALSERCLYSLALDDDDDPAGRALSSAMLFAAIQTPQSSPQRESSHASRSSQHSPLGKRGGASPLGGARA